MIACEDFAFEDFKLLSIYVVLMFAPCWPALLVLQSPVYREEWREHLKLIAGYEHLVHLSVARIAVAHKAFVVRRIAIGSDKERLVKELKGRERRCENVKNTLTLI